MSTLFVRKHTFSYAILAAPNTAYEQVVAKGVPEEFMAKQFSCVPELVDAAIFAASVLKTRGLFDISEQQAYQKLEGALAIADVKIDTPATQMYDAQHKKGGK